MKNIFIFILCAGFYLSAVAQQPKPAPKPSQTAKPAARPQQVEPPSSSWGDADTALASKASQYWKDGEYEEAIQTMETVESAHPSDGGKVALSSFYTNYLIICKERRSMPQDSLTAFFDKTVDKLLVYAKQLKRKEDAVAICNQLIGLHRTFDRSDDAALLPVLTQAIKLDRENVDFYVQKGDLLAKLERKTEACETYKEAFLLGATYLKPQMESLGCVVPPEDTSRPVKKRKVDPAFPGSQE